MYMSRLRIRHFRREYAALRSIDRDDTLRLTEKQSKEVKERIKRLEKDIRDQIRNAYRLIYIPDQDGGLRELDMGIGTYGQDIPLDEEVYEKLRTEGEILDRIEPLVLKERFLGDRDYIATWQLVESWSRTPGALRVVSENAWRHAIEEGVRRGLFGLGILEDGHPRCMAYKESPAVALSGQEVLIRADICEAQKEEEKKELYSTPNGPNNGVSEPSGGSGGTGEDIEVPPEPVFRDIHLQFTLPRGKVAHLLGILRFLQEKFNRMEITLHVSDGEVSEQDFENKVQEAFRQIGIEPLVRRNP